MFVCTSSLLTFPGRREIAHSIKNHRLKSSLFMLDVFGYVGFSYCLMHFIFWQFPCLSCIFVLVVQLLSHIYSACWPWPVALSCWVVPSQEPCLVSSMAEQGWDLALSNWLHCHLPCLNLPFNLERLGPSFALFPRPCTLPGPYPVQRLGCANIAELKAISNVVI